MNRLDLTRWLVRHTRQFLPTLTLAVLARVVGQLLGVALLVVAVSRLAAAAAGESVSIAGTIWLLAAIALVKAGLRYAEHYAGHWVAFTSLQSLRNLFFDSLIPQAPAATRGKAGAELTERATRDIDRIEVFFAHTLPPAVTSILVPAASLVWLGVAVDPRLALAAAPFIIGGVVVAPWLAGRATWRAAAKVAGKRGDIAAHLGDDLQGMREVLAFNAVDRRLAGLDQADAALVAARARSGRIQAVRAAVGTVLQLAAVAAPLLAGVWLGLPAANIAVAIAVVVALWKPAQGVDDFVTGLDASFAAAERIRRVVDGVVRVTDPERPSPEPPGSTLALVGVTMTYPGATAPALNAVTVSFPARSWSRVVGVSGSGKSTLATLLPRGFDPEAGSVRLGGVDVRELLVDDVRRRVALVAQRPTMLKLSLAANLRLAAPGATDTQLAAALHAVALDDWCAALPERFETPIGERGTTLSGGQLQRLALARALVGRPDVLVLDEALSQLDAATAAQVCARIAAGYPDLTVVEVTHRADLIPDDAPVTVLDQGRVVESGLAGFLRVLDGPLAHLQARVD